MTVSAVFGSYIGVVIVVLCNEVRLGEAAVGGLKVAAMPTM